MSKHEDPRIRFLKDLRPDEPTLLAAIPAKGGTPTPHWFRLGGEAVTVDWIEQSNRTHNIYFHVNRVRSNFKDRKASAKDIDRIDFAHLDADVPKNRQMNFLERPFEERAKLFEDQLKKLGGELSSLFLKPESPIPMPSFRWSSGGGSWALWRVFEDVSADDAVELNKALIAAAGRWGDKTTFDISRLARLPGTTNHPDEKKREQGRGPRMAGNAKPLFKGGYEVSALLDAARTVTDRLSGAKKPAKGSGEARRGSGQRKGSCSARHPLTAPFDPNDMPELVGDVSLDLAEYDLGDRTLALIQNGVAAIDDGDRDKKADGADPSASGWAWEIMCDFARAGVPVGLAVAASECEHYAFSKYRSRPKKTISRDSFLGELANAAQRIIDDGDWTAARAAKHKPDGPDFIVDKKGNPYNDQQQNIREAIRALGARVSFNEFANTMLIDGLPGSGPELDDAARDALWLKIDTAYGFKPQVTLWDKLLPALARENTYHPVRDYLDNLPQWDGVPRVDTWLIEYGSAENTELNQAVGALTLIAAIRRVREPGCKFDEMLVLEGETGVGKSTAIETLCPDRDWFSDSVHFGLRDRETLEQVMGRWIIEVPELKGMRKSDADARKAFLSRNTDRGRLAYARTPSTVPRTCIFVGTTNDETYLNDPTGNRRFWPVKVGRFDLGRLTADRDMLWAEAAEREAKGEYIRLSPRLYPAATDAQKSREVRSAVLDQLEDALGNSEGKITSLEVRLFFGIEGHSQSANQALYNQIGHAMKELGWERKKLRHGGEPVWAYQKGNTDAWLYLSRQREDTL